MTIQFAFPGLDLAVATPSAPESAIDFARLECDLERQFAIGMKSFVISSGTGMHVYLSEGESRTRPSRIADIDATLQKPKALPPAMLTAIGAKATIAYRPWPSGTE
jgi:4-hydroxy-tetrahydrodipicolinate synthase